MSRPGSNAEPRDVNLVQVILARFEMLGHSVELAWVKREGTPFRVADRATGKLAWFPTYELAREVFSKCCEEAGQPTFRSHERRKPYTPPVLRELAPDDLSAEQREWADDVQATRRQGGAS